MFIRTISAVAMMAFVCAASAQEAASLANKRVVFLGDSITQAGGYIGIVDYHLQKAYPKLDFDLIGLGLASETLSGLSEDGHAGGKFPRPCLFERLARLLEKARPEVVFACYGMNDGIYLPLDKDRTAAFHNGVTRLLDDCQKAGVKQVYLVTPPIYDFKPRPGEFNYDTVLQAYGEWELTLKRPGLRVIDLHSPMRTAREARTEPFSKDKVHPGDEGQLLVAKTILAALGEDAKDLTLAKLKADPMYKLVDDRRKLRSSGWMKHIGYTREATFAPQPIGTTETDAAKLQEKVNTVRRSGSR